MLRSTDEQWRRIREHLPEENIPEGRPGRKPAPTRQVLEAMLCILNTGVQWQDLPKCYPNYKTVHRRFQTQREQDVLRDIMTALANELRDRSDINERERFIDATFASAKGGGDAMDKTRCGMGVKILTFVDRSRLPLSVSTHAANHHKVTLVQLSFDFYMIEAKPAKLIADNAYDSDALVESLKEQGVEMIVPHCSNRTLKTQDSRALRRYQRRGLVERFFAWLQWKRRLLVRWESYADNFLGLVQLASVTMLLKRN